MAKRWRCLVCGYIHVGDEPPHVCPICGAPKRLFELIEDDARTEAAGESEP